MEYKAFKTHNEKMIVNIKRLAKLIDISNSLRTIKI